MVDFYISLLFLFLRILLLGSERIFLSKLGKYDSVVVSAIFFLTTSILLIPGMILIPNLLTIGIWFSFISAFSYAIGFYAYVKALSIEDASLIAPLYNSSLLWLFILSVLFLDDVISIFRIIGALLIFFGFFFLYSGKLNQKLQKLKESKGSLIMIFGSLFIALGRTIDSYAFEKYPQTNEVLYAISMNFFVGLYLFILVILLNKDFNILKSIFKNEKRNLIFGSLANGWAYLFLLLALLGLEITIVEPASLLSIFVTAFLAKTFLQEEVKERIPGTIIIVIGSIFLFTDKFF